MNIDKRKSIVTLVLVLGISLSCSFPSPQGSGQPDLAATITAMTQIPPPPANQATPIQPISETALPATTPTLVLTPTSTVPMVTVSVATNCRTGPGEAYDRVGSLPVGVSAEIVGKSTSANYWIIKNPDSSGTCWLWGQYATVSGNVAALQEYAIPASPTLRPTSTLTLAPATPTVTSTATPISPPAAPKNINLFDKQCIFIEPGKYELIALLTWDDAANNEDGYNIYYYNLDTDEEALLYTMGANSVQSQLHFLGGEKGNIYVEAFNSAGHETIAIRITCP